MEIAVRGLRPEEQWLAAAVTARSLRDDPSTVAMYGPDPLVRVASLHSLFRDHFRTLPAPQVAAFYDGFLVGVAAAAAPGGCIGALMGDVAVELLAERDEPHSARRPQMFWAHWAARDLPVPHWHLGPVGVEPGYQGQGVGSAMLRALCEVYDRDGQVAWLETDKEKNVRFYTAAGFEVAETATVLDVPVWFMRRDPA
jgi:ribosomal protein S18 acetylase RimI-like enzyme